MNKEELIKELKHNQRQLNIFKMALAAINKKVYTEANRKKKEHYLSCIEHYKAYVYRLKDSIKELEEIEKPNGWEKVEPDGECFTIGDISVLAYHGGDYLNGARYDRANCFSNLIKAKEVDKIDILNRKLLRFCEENNGQVDWNKRSNPKYYIVFNHGIEEFDIFETYSYERIGQVCFSTRELTEKAIDTFKDDILEVIK